MLPSNGLTRRRAGSLAGVAVAAGLLILIVFALANPGAQAQVRARAAWGSPVTGNDCPSMVYEPKASLYPALPSFHAGYDNFWERLNDTTAKWGFVVSAQFPYSQWMSWNIYDIEGVPTFTINRTAIDADPGSMNPYRDKVPLLAPDRSYHLYLMPDSTPAGVIRAMQAKYGEGNVAKLPSIHGPSLNGVVSWAITQRSYWSFAFDGIEDWDRFGYGGPTNTPFPTIHAFLTDPRTGALTNTPAGDCGAQSILPKRTWFNPATGKPVITAALIPRPVARIVNPPQFLLNHGFLVGSSPPWNPPAPVPRYVQFFRSATSQAPYADVSQIPAKGTPPDGCGGYVVANLPNNRVSLVHVPQVPSFPNYTGATPSTLRNNSDEVQFWSLIMYGVNRQVFTFGNPNPVQALRNSELGNQEVAKNSDGSATFVIYPVSANPAQVARIAAIAKANGWNILHGGVKTRNIPMNLLTLREKGMNQDWPNAISANNVSQGAPCYFSNPAVPADFPFNKVPASFQVTQTNGMGLTAPNGQNCTIRSFVTGRCLKALMHQYKMFSWKWNAANVFPSGQLGGGGEGGGDSGGA